MRIVLASASPRRAELLRRLVAEFAIVPSRIEEYPRGRPEEFAVDAAREKARDVASREHGVIIGADTIVVDAEEILGKPRSREDAGRMLEQLSGREHQVLTGLCVVHAESRSERTALERTTVRFRPLRPSEIDAYLELGEYVDKAGAYGIQGHGALLVDWICGDYYNVMGLPLCRLLLLLREVGVAV